MASDRYETFVDVLCKLPETVWSSTVYSEPEWKWMLPLSRSWEFGHFAALFMTLGLNDFQTKGKADVGYWPKVVPLIRNQSEPNEPGQLIGLLKQFFANERLAVKKVNRLERFATSSLCAEIWTCKPETIAADFKQTWRSLGETMKQPPTKKTIAFAMKCLALALLMVNEDGFDISSIPVPIDSRLRAVALRLGCASGTDSDEQHRWSNALEKIRNTGKQITMVHLDSLLWQIGTLSREEMQSHLVSLNAGGLAQKIASLFVEVEEIADFIECCPLSE